MGPVGDGTGLEKGAEMSSDDAYWAINGVRDTMRNRILDLVDWSTWIVILKVDTRGAILPLWYITRDRVGGDPRRMP